MPLQFRATLNRSVQSLDAGRELGRALASAAPSAALVFASVEHDQPALLAGVREVLGREVALIGCSTQGVMGRGTTVEGGYFAAAMGFGGEFRAAVARANEAQRDPAASGRALGAALKAQLPTARLALVFFDPFAGVDASQLVAGLQAELPCVIAGGAASQPWGSMVKTYQYWGDEVFSHGAVAIALDGPFAVEVGASHGTEPIGLEHVVTRVEGTQIVELDERPAAVVWQEALGVPSTAVSQMAALALGLPNPPEQAQELGEYRVLAPTFFDPKTGGFHVLTEIPKGTSLALHYRSTRSVLEGTQAMARSLKERVGTRRVVAALGFECGARTEAFLGREATTREAIDLQRTLAPDAEWIGMMAWGEVLPLAARTEVVNYTFPVVCLLEP